MRTTLSLLAVSLLVPAVLAEPPAAAPATPAAVEGLISARPFTLEKGFQFDWCKERPIVKTGYLVVLKVKPDLVYPRQTAEPILYVGKQTALRVNHGYPSGHVIAIVPGKVDLEKAPMWFGTPGLPEQVTAETVKKERALAKAAGIKPLAAKQVKAALQLGGKPLKAADDQVLLVEAGKLILRHSPAERELAEGLIATGQK